ncbi:MAG: hypothetical protein WCV86_01290 [Patescibacteria group bacterium]
MSHKTPSSLLSAEVLRGLHSLWSHALMALLRRDTIATSTMNDTELAQELQRVSRLALGSAIAAPYGFVILSAPSGGGKGTIGKELQTHGFSRLPRVTTRAPRPGEVDGIDYIFLSRKRFTALADAGAFLQTAETHEELRGTLREEFRRLVRSEKPFYVEGSLGGYEQFLSHEEVRAAHPLSVFLLPPSFDVLAQRLGARSDDDMTPREFEGRLNKAIEHLRRANDLPYDVFYVNDIIPDVTGRILADFNPRR